MNWKKYVSFTLEDESDGDDNMEVDSLCRTDDCAITYSLATEVEENPVATTVELLPMISMAQLELV
jgi:hypothetical protein